MSNPLQEQQLLCLSRIYQTKRKALLKTMADSNFIEDLVPFLRHESCKLIQKACVQMIISDSCS